MNVEEALIKFQSLSREIKYLLDELGYDCENIFYDESNANERFLRNQFYYLADKLDDIKRHIDYLSKPVIVQGHLSKNSAGRYELSSGYYFTSGSVCEVLYENRSGEQYWVYTSIEHNGEDYYFTTLKDVPLQGAMVRARG